MSDNLLSDRVYNWFIARLHEGKLLPGQRLNRRQVADEVGVSVAPVLEAMVRLESEGFLETVPRRGTSIRQITPVSVFDQQVLREAIECQAARLSCGRRVSDDLPRLTKLARRADESAGAGGIDWRAEFAFHRALVELAGCAPLLEVYEQVTRRLLYHAANGMLRVPDPEGFGEQHAELLEALTTDNPEAAASLIREHIAVQTRWSPNRRLTPPAPALA